MGKCKRRTLYKSNSSLYMTREKAAIRVGEYLKEFDINSKSKSEARDIITLFGLSAEELSEAGVAFEYLKSLENIIYNLWRSSTLLFLSQP